MMTFYVQTDEVSYERKIVVDGWDQEAMFTPELIDTADPTQLAIIQENGIEYIICTVANGHARYQIDRKDERCLYVHLVESEWAPPDTPIPPRSMHVSAI